MTNHPDVAQVAAIVGGLGVALVLVPSRRVPILVGLVLIATAMGGLAYSLVPGNDLRALVDSPARLAAVSAVALALAALAALFVRYPAIVPVAALVAVPFRVPVDDREPGGLPAASALCRSCRSDPRARVRRSQGREARPDPPRAGLAGHRLHRPLGTVGALGRRCATRNHRAALLPPALRLSRGGRRQGACCTLAAEGADRDARRPCLRVRLRGDHPALDRRVSTSPPTSRSRTPTRRTSARPRSSRTRASTAASSSVAIVVLVSVLWLARISLWAAGALIAFLWVGLYFSYSQSSMVALAVPVLAVGLVAGTRLDRRVLVLGAVVLGAAAIAVTAVRPRRLGAEGNERADGADRGHLASVRREPDRRRRRSAASLRQPGSEGGARATDKNASHTTPLTVAAELGVLGLARLRRVSLRRRSAAACRLPKRSRPRARARVRLPCPLRPFAVLRAASSRIP